MEFRRTFIMVALATVTYFMFLAWQQDYGQPAATTAATTPVPAASEPVVPAVTGDLSVPTAPASSELSDLPTAPVVNAAPASGLPTADSAASVRSNLITITTDALRLQIDPQGGDIVSAHLLKYTDRVGSDQAFVLMDRSAALNYVAQTGFIGANVPGLRNALSGFDDRSEGRPQYTSAQTNYTLPAGQDRLRVSLTATTPEGVSVIKHIDVFAGRHDVSVTQEVQNQSDRVWTGTPFAQIKRDGSADPSADNHSFGVITFLGGAWWTPEKSYNKVTLADFGTNTERPQVTGGWVAMVQHYFVTAWVPAADQRHLISTRQSANGEHFIGYTGDALVVEPGESTTQTQTFYAGPKIQSDLEALSPGLELTVDYGWLWPIAQFLFWILSSVQSVIGNWGWSIVALTVLVKAAFFHLSATSYRSMANMRRVMPELQRMKERFGDDRAKMSQAMMELYKKEKINPLGGCLPILVQMPVFIALYWTLMESVELRHAGWIGWINDLSLMDPYFILPLLMGVTMYVQQSLNPTPVDPMQAKIMKYLPVVFTVFFLWFPAGLVLYWLVNNVLSIAQQWYITRQIEQKGSQAA